MSGNGSVSYKNNFVPENLLNYNDNNSYENKTIYNISESGLEQLKLDYYIYLY